MLSIMRQESALAVKVKNYRTLDESNETLVQQVGDGSIVKRFERTPLPIEETDVVCPHFLELKWAYGCPFNCSWCYLKGTLRLLPTKTKPVVKDYERIRKHLQAFFSYNGEKEILNTGELADSLMTENGKSPFSKFIIPIFESQSKHKVLFLTKSNKIENLLNMGEHSKTVVSFSINADPVSKKWEKAPSPKERIEAARRLYEVGYEVRIRIDPIVPITDWDTHYRELIDSVFDNFIPERITLGTLRGLQSTINQATDKSWTEYLSEYSNWGRKTKFDTRKTLYSKCIEYLSKKYDYNEISLCKETISMWKIMNLNHKNIKCNCTW